MKAPLKHATFTYKCKNVYARDTVFCFCKIGRTIVFSIFSVIAVMYKNPASVSIYFSGSHASLHVEMNPLHPRHLPEFRFLGADHCE